MLKIKPMVYDCFSFFNELDMLEIRLNILDKVVDKFVIVEADRTHTGITKAFNFEINKDRFSDFMSKIIYIKLTKDDLPKYDNNAWIYENIQRNIAIESLTNCNPDDFIIISDLDEIPNPKTIQQEMLKDGIRCLRQKYYSFWLNNYCFGRPDWIHPKILKYKNLSTEINVPDLFYEQNITLNKKVNAKTTLTKIRLYHLFHKLPVVANGGWHFSSIGTPKKISEKLISYAHQEFNSTKYTDDKKIQMRIYSGKDMAGRPERNYVVVPIDKNFPEFIFNNQIRYVLFIRKYHVLFTPLLNVFIKLRFILYWRCQGMLLKIKGKTTGM